MIIKKIDLTSDRFNEQKILIQLNYTELSKLANAIHNIEVKSEDDAWLPKHSRSGFMKNTTLKYFSTRR